MQKLKPLHDNIIVKRMSAKEQTDKGIIIPDAFREKINRGQVLYVGNGKNIDGKVHPMTIKCGDNIIFGKYSGNEIDLNNEKVLIIKEEEVLAIIE